MSVFNGKPHNFQTRKYDVSTTSPVIKISNISTGRTLVFFTKYFLKLLCKSKHIQQKYKRKRGWAFFSEHSV